MDDPFFQRHPDLSERKPEKLSKVRALVSKEKIQSWFYEVKDYLSENNNVHILSDPNRVFSLDEASFYLCPKTGKVIAAKGQKNIYKVHSGSDKENLTVLCNIGASGKVAPTMVVYPGQRLPQSLKLQMPEGWSHAKSDSGWMNSATFFEYMANIFYKWLQDQGCTFPVIVFVDGHKSHLTYQFILLTERHHTYRTTTELHPHNATT